MYLEGSEGFADFELLDSGDGYRLERWGDYLLARPDPQIIWQKSLPESEWAKADAIFRDDQWHYHKEIPESWILHFQKLKLIVRPTNFKHTGVFPEQAANWQWMANLLSNQDRPKILSLFGYTGAATLWLTLKGAFVTHVDASRPAIGWAKDNQELNGLDPSSVRWILDDALKFVKAEVRREAVYDGIVMDPPAFGHGPSGNLWKFNLQMPALIEASSKLLADRGQFLLVNAYATNTSELAINNLLEDYLKPKNGSVQAGQLCLKQRGGRLLSTGIFARWQRKE